ncbi:MAG: DNA primase [Candidatus Jettenia ecosi]|uniref:DNA primase n=1 Tax=Candidatus Jettenia ecosi TaxID=2494326 RepID=A0A533Q7K7_9BACT|nr:MAG: DNA primase [Candidatus Jettenia ecosi]
MNGTLDVLRGMDYRSFYTRHIPGFETNGKTEVSCHCPFHDDKEPSLSVNLEKGVFKCFGCSEQGGVVKFIQLLYGLDKKDALERIKEEEGIKPDSESSSGGKPKAKTRNSEPTYLTLDQVKLIHNQLLKNEAILKTFQDKYGLSLETIEKYFIGYQNEHYVIPIETEPGRWALKEHKGLQSHGAKVSLYPSDIIKKDLPYIVIAEGEFKALLLNQMGFPSIAGTGGANTWKREWNSHFTNLDVILAYDNDVPGRQGATKVVESFKGIARNVKMIQWPSFMDSQDKKDVTDFFVTLGKTKEDFQRLIDHAEEMVYEIKEIDGVRFIEPAGFRVNESLVNQVTEFHGCEIIKPAFYTPLFITGRAIDVDHGMEELEISFKRDGKRKKLWVAKLVVSDMKKILELSNHGLPVNSRNAGKMIEYLAAFEAFNMQLIPKTFISKGFGFKSVDGKRVFILEKMVGKKAGQDNKEVSVEFFPEPGFERFVRAVKQEGTYVKWRECIEPTLKYPYAAFAFYGSFAAPLLRMLKAPNFIIDFWGNTSVGKTTVLELAASVWGNPHKEAGGLVFGWDSTRVFLERIANFFCDLPIFPDDSQTVDDRTLSNMLYQIANGVGKGRGSTVGVRHNPTWHTVCFSTGERPLIECTAFAGARARTIELYGSPFPNEKGDFINDLKTGLRENYGHAGSKFIEGILSIWNNTDTMTRLKADYKMYQRALSLEANSEVGDRYSQYFAVVKLAADLVHEILGIGDPVAARDSIDRVFDNVINESLNDVDVGTRAMRHVLSWASGNEKYFTVMDNDKDKGQEVYGQWKEGEYIGIFPHKLEDVLEKAKFSKTAILKAWSERGWIKRDDDTHLTCARDVKIAVGMVKKRRMILIPWSVVEEFIGK